MNGDKIFVDTNILVYGHDADAGQKHQIARNLLKRAGGSHLQLSIWVGKGILY